MQTTLLEKIKKIKKDYLSDGIEIVGVFGSVARGEDDSLSDIDITYKLNYELFFKKYRDGFAQILKIDELKDALERALQRRVDLISLTAGSQSLKEEIERDVIYV